MGKIAIRASIALLAAGAFTTVAAALPPTSSVPASRPGVASLAAYRPVSLNPASGEPVTREYQCGTVGLDVVASSSEEREYACDTAKKVAKAAMEGGAPGPAGGWSSGLTIEVDGQTWSCQNRQGDDDPDPHGMCVNNSRESEQVRLYS
ncbi:hypothetical protein [Nonomuraea diastatica]|uniref:Subtilisin inhibitor domain-containing protein n=1 Tax=Nonomuraea diastatica TaxID=1848329 RepID=A0A4R4WIW0_9ACTN|nr:hypothetical protein [Nonomuraea diastatica]TDD18942.1 hypothetical protein E1294_22755 [Nonomuraea diastatica]